MRPHRLLPILLLGAYLAPLSASEGNAAASDHSAYFQDMEEAEKAYKSVFDRFGREPLDTLRADLLRDLPGYRSRGEFRAALQIFELTRDAEGVAKVFASIPESLRNDAKLFEELGWYVSDSGALGRRAWLKALPSGYYYPWNVTDLLDDIRSKGPTSNESMRILQKLAANNPSIFVQYLDLQANAQRLVENLVRNYPSADAADKIRIGGRMSVLMKNSEAYRSHIVAFYSLLDPEKQEDRAFWLECASCLGEWTEGADFLIKHLHDEYSPAEIEAAGMMCSMRVDDAMLRQWAKASRYQRLVSFLMNAGRVQDAQKYAEEGFGKGVDAMQAVDVWNKLGAIQQASGARTFEGMLKQAEPKADTWEYFNNRFAYYLGRKEPEKALEALQAAVDKGRETGNPGMVCSACMAWGNYLREKARGPDGKMADDPRREEYVRAMDCYEKAYEASCGMEDGPRAWCAGRIIEECGGSMYRTVFGQAQAESRLREMYKAELAAGYPLAAGIRHAAEKTPVRIDDPVFSAITDPKRCKGIEARGLADGFLIQLSYAREGEVPPLLEKMAQALEEKERQIAQAVEAIERNKGFLERYPIGDTFCQSIIFARDVPWRAAAARYALQRYPDYYSPFFPDAAASLLEAALPALDVSEGREWADRIWKRKAMRVEMRLSILQALQKKADPASPEYRQIGRECEEIFGSTGKTGR